MGKSDKEVFGLQVGSHVDQQIDSYKGLRMNLHVDWIPDICTLPRACGGFVSNLPLSQSFNVRSPMVVGASIYGFPRRPPPCCLCSPFSHPPFHICLHRVLPLQHARGQLVSRRPFDSSPHVTSVSIVTSRFT